MNSGVPRKLVHDQHVVEVEYQSDSQLPHSGYHWFYDLGENVGGTAQSKWEGLELPFLAFPMESKNFWWDA